MKDREAWLTVVHGIAKPTEQQLGYTDTISKSSKGCLHCNFCEWIFSSSNNSKNKRLECFLDNRKFSAE